MKPKKLDIFILRSFLLLFVAALCIVLFVLLMNVLWRWVGDLVGKGFTIGTIAQFFYLSTLSLVPQALPLAVLMAALITFGNFGERVELLAMKTAGISLLRIMRPLTVFCIILAGVSFYFQNVVSPNSQRKLLALGYSIEQKSPELEIPEGVFYDQISGYNMYVKHKDQNTGTLYDITFYNLSDGYDNLTVTVADSAKLETTEDKQHLYLHLFSGEQFGQDEEVSQSGQPYRRESFREKHILLDFDSDFNVVNESMMGGMAASKNMAQIRSSIDSISMLQDSLGLGTLSDYRSTGLNTFRLVKSDSVKLAQSTVLVIPSDSAYSVATLARQADIRNTMRSTIQTQVSEMNVRGSNMEYNDKQIRKHWIEWMKKISYSTAILVFFFIGAPLGAIIRKGGLGVPVIVSVLLFILFYITSVSGEKMYREGEWSIIGCWLSTIVLAPMSVFFTVKANNDSTVFQIDVIKEFLRHWFGGRASRNIVRKDVVIDDPDKEHCLGLLSEIRTASADLASSDILNRIPQYGRLFFSTLRSDSLNGLNDNIEKLVEELGNSRNRVELEMLNELPVIPAYGVESPFAKTWVNRMLGIVFPLGLVFELRAWLFSRKIRAQMVKTEQVSRDLMNYMNGKLTN